jgi:putative addiction module killer protein
MSSKGHTKYKLQREPDFEQWFARETFKSQSQIEKRLANIVNEGHFGHTNFFDGILEIKFTDGRRIYSLVFHSKEAGLVILLLGGGKNGQQKDIEKAKKKISKIISSL